MVLARDLVLAINLNFGFACFIPYYGVSPCHDVSCWPVFWFLCVLARIWCYIRVMVLTVNRDYGVNPYYVVSLSYYVSLCWLLTRIMV